MSALGQVLKNLLAMGARQEALTMLQSSKLPFSHLGDMLVKDIVPGHYGWTILYLQQLPVHEKEQKQHVVKELCTERIAYLTRMQCNAGIVVASSATLCMLSSLLPYNGLLFACLSACGGVVGSATAVSLDLDICALKTCREALF
jgi:hypothetical protein